MESVDGLGKGAKWLQRSNESFQPGEILNVGCCDDVAEDDDEGDEWREKNRPILENRMSYDHLTIEESRTNAYMSTEWIHWSLSDWRRRIDGAPVLPGLSECTQV